MPESKEKELQECFIIMPIADVDGYPDGHFRHVYDKYYCSRMWNGQLKATLAAANTVGVLGLLFLLTTELYNSQFQDVTLFKVALGFGVFWVLGFIFAVILSVFLFAPFQKLSLRSSLALFLIVGFIVPFGLGYLASNVPAHGNPSDWEADKLSALSLILVYSIIGSLAAYAAWRSLRKNSFDNKRHNNIGSLEVSMFAFVDDSCNHTKNCIHEVDGKKLGKAKWAAITKPSDDGSCYLFLYYSDDIFTDTAHESVNEAKEQAEWEYEGISKNWNNAT